MHFQLKGWGLQTWEYSPEYALRSYAYTGAHAAIALFGSLIASNKLALFFLVRSGLALISAAAETSLYTALRDSTIAGPRAAMLLLAALLSSTGLFIASAGYTCVRVWLWKRVVVLFFQPLSWPLCSFSAQQLRHGDVYLCTESVAAWPPGVCRVFCCAWGTSRLAVCGGVGDSTRPRHGAAPAHAGTAHYR